MSYWVSSEAGARECTMNRGHCGQTTGITDEKLDDLQLDEQYSKLEEIRVICDTGVVASLARHPMASVSATVHRWLPWRIRGESMHARHLASGVDVYPTSRF